MGSLLTPAFRSRLLCFQNAFRPEKPMVVRKCHSTLFRFVSLELLCSAMVWSFAHYRARRDCPSVPYSSAIQPPSSWVQDSFSLLSWLLSRDSPLSGPHPYFLFM